MFDAGEFHCQVVFREIHKNILTQRFLEFIRKTAGLKKLIKNHESPRQYFVTTYVIIISEMKSIRTSKTLECNEM